VVGGKEGWRVSRANEAHAPGLLLSCHLALIGCRFLRCSFSLVRFTVSRRMMCIDDQPPRNRLGGKTQEPEAQTISRLPERETLVEIPDIDAGLLETF